MARDWMVYPSKGAWRYAAALGFVALSTLAAEAIYRVFHTDRLSMVFLAGVLTSAVTLGRGPAYFAAAIAFGIYEIYLVEPRFRFSMTSAEDVLVLAVFLAVAVLTGGLAGRLREAQGRAEARARASAVLFRSSEEFAASDDEDAICQALANRIADAGHGAVVLAGAGRWSMPPDTAAPPAAAMAQAQAAIVTVCEGGWRLRAMRAEGEALGVAAWRREDSHALDDDDRTIAVVVDMAAAAIVRSRLAARRAEIEARDRTEALRNALLSSISHDLRTPLAAILASATSLREFGEQFEPETRADLTLTIQEEAERLNAFVGNLLNMTKLESGALKIETVSFGLAEVVGRVVERVQRRGGGEFMIDLPDEALLALGDPILAEQALANVVENAVRFAGAEQISITLRRKAGRAVVEVADLGPGVPAADLPMIFEKFYRSAAASNLQGTGLGLSISRGLLEAMGGDAAASPRDDGRPGLVVTLAFPEGTTP
jgi:K+-sensing histidine kinase KdpD